MTVVGKIFVILNLVASLFVGTLLIIVYTARIKLEVAHKKTENSLQVAQAEKTLAENREREAKEALNNEIKKGQALVEDERTRHQKTQQSLDEEKRKFQARNDDANRGTNTTTLSEATIKSLQTEVEQLQEAKKKLDDRINDPKEGLLVQMDKLRQEKVTAEIERRSLLVRNAELQSRVEDMAKQLVKSQSGPIASTSGGSRPLRNPPQEDVEGLVLKTDKDTGYLTLSIGSDSGLSKGHTLEVFRLSKVPSQSRYLGTIEILRVGPKEAVGKPVQRMLGTVEAGDQVSSRILDS